MDQLNNAIMKRYSKERKVGEGTVSLQRASLVPIPYLCIPVCVSLPGPLRGDGQDGGYQKGIYCRLESDGLTTRQIKIGQFKDGLDMSAIREVKFLQELKHENVIEVGDILS